MWRESAMPRRVIRPASMNQLEWAAYVFGVPMSMVSTHPDMKIQKDVDLDLASEVATAGAAASFFSVNRFEVEGKYRYTIDFIIPKMGRINRLTDMGGVYSSARSIRCAIENADPKRHFRVVFNFPLPVRHYYGGY